MRILVIGGTGVISKEVVELAAKRNEEIFMLNRGKSKSNVSSKVGRFQCDIRNKEEVKQAIGNQAFDVVIDCLSYRPEQLEKTLNLFYNKCKQYIFISSATAYEKERPHEIITEKTKVGNSKWDYAFQKSKCEEVLIERCRNIGLKYTIVRPYVTYDETRIPFQIIPLEAQWSLIYRIKNRKPIILADSGTAVCTLTHSKDFAYGILGLCGNEKAFNQDFHITSEEELTWKHVLDAIGNALGTEPIIVDIPALVIGKELPEWKGLLLGDKGTDMRFDNSKIKSVVEGFTCKIPFEEGIKDSIAFYQNNKTMQKINYHWDGQMDYLVAKYGKKTIKKYELKKIKTSRSIRDNFKYLVGRYRVLSTLMLIPLKIRRKVKQG